MAMQVMINKSETERNTYQSAIDLRNQLLEGTAKQHPKFEPVTLTSLPPVLDRDTNNRVNILTAVANRHVNYVAQWLYDYNIMNRTDDLRLVAAMSDPYLSYVGKALLALLHVRFGGPSLEYQGISTKEYGDIFNIGNESLRWEFRSLFFRGYLWGATSRRPNPDEKGYYNQAPRLPQFARIPLESEYEWFYSLPKRGPLQVKVLDAPT
jgi:hypothetical protein